MWHARLPHNDRKAYVHIYRARFNPVQQHAAHREGATAPHTFTQPRLSLIVEVKTNLYCRAVQKSLPL